MSAKSHRSDYVIIAVMGGISAAVVLALAASGWFGQDKFAQHPVRTTYSANAEGTVVCYELLERLDMAVRRSERPLLEDTLDEIDLLLLIDQIIPINETEQSALGAWVRAGGVLVMTDTPGGVRRSLHEIETSCSYTNTSRSCTDASCSPKGGDPTWCWGEPTSIADDARTLPLARDAEPGKQLAAVPPPTLPL